MLRRHGRRGRVLQQRQASAGRRTSASLFGKILRLDPNAREPYAAAGNPSTARPRGSGTMVCATCTPSPSTGGRATSSSAMVGRDSYEEVDYVPAGTSGMNFGWPKRKAPTRIHARAHQCARATRIPSPIADMDRRQSATGSFRDYKSVVSGFVYRGSRCRSSGASTCSATIPAGKWARSCSAERRRRPSRSSTRTLIRTRANAPAFTRQGNLLTLQRAHRGRRGQRRRAILRRESQQPGEDRSRDRIWPPRARAPASRARP